METLQLTWLENILLIISMVTTGLLVIVYLIGVFIKYRDWYAKLEIYYSGFTGLIWLVLLIVLVWF